MLTAILLVTSLIGTPNPCDHDAQVVKQVVPDFPASFRRPGHPLQETVSIAVYLDATGKVSRTEIKQSSGIADFDNSALTAANQSTYRPRVVNCKPVAGEYIFKVTFSGA